MILGYINKIDLSVLLFTNNKYEYLKITNIVQAKNEILVVDSSIAPSLKVIPDSSAQRPLSAHLKFNSAPVKSLHACSDLKEGAIPGVSTKLRLGYTARCGLN